MLMMLVPLLAKSVQSLGRAAMSSFQAFQWSGDRRGMLKGNPADADDARSCGSLNTSNRCVEAAMSSFSFNGQEIGERRWKGNSS